MAEIESWLQETSKNLGQSVRPIVTLSYAQSLDGSLSLRRGEPLAISGQASQELTHRLRAGHDAVLIGIDTVIADDPQLNVRLAQGDDPQVVVLDSQLRFPLAAKLLNNKKKPWIFCTSQAAEKRQQKLEDAGAAVQRQTNAVAAHVDLPQMLERLGELGIGSLMVEGGGHIISSFLAEDLVDRVVLTIAPMFVGGYKIAERNLARRGGDFPRLDEIKVEMVGEDIVILGTINR
ncbi:MAG: RibD family protein [Anaerolineales bacterium]